MNTMLKIVWLFKGYMFYKLLFNFIKLVWHFKYFVKAKMFNKLKKK